MTLRAIESPEWKTVVWFAPRNGGRAVRAWLAGTGSPAFLAQSAGDLGARLAAAFDAHFERGARRVVIIGSDSPAVSADLLVQAFDALQRHDVAIGPALDGGYYLIALRRPLPDLFSNIEWSTEAVLSQTLAAAARHGLSVWLGPALRDVDTASDARAAGLLRSPRR
jgi:rSAM/selenodomain-associated transferase 1